jgi:hypothetical protein
MHKHCSLLLALSLLAFFSVTGSAQIAPTDKSLAALRDHDRAPVTQLVNDFLQYQRSQQWGLLYDLFSSTYIRLEMRSAKRIDYVEKRQALTAEGRTTYIVDFTLRRVLVNDPFDGQYSFAGCANVFRDGQIQFTNAHIDLILETDVWRIADYGMFATCQPPDLECKK